MVDAGRRDATWISEIELDADDGWRVLPTIVIAFMVDDEPRLDLEHKDDLPFLYIHIVIPYSIMQFSSKHQPVMLLQQPCRILQHPSRSAALAQVTSVLSWEHMPYLKPNPSTRANSAASLA